MTIRMLAVLALSVLLLGQSLRESALRIWHEWERESFAQYFCVNIDEPAVMCYGQCQIDELDAEHQAGDQGASIRPPVKRLGSLDYCFDHPTLRLKQLSGKPGRVNFSPVIWQGRAHPLRIFRPPLGRA